MSEKPGGQHPDRDDLFDRWAAQYDAAVQSTGKADQFPFAGYNDVLATVVREAAAKPGMTVVDLGTGTGALAAMFVAAGCTVYATDFSGQMLAQAREKVPGATFVQANLLDGWPDALPGRVDRIVCSYVFHEFDDDAKLRLIRSLALHLADGGRLVIADIAFPNEQARQQAHAHWARRWDEDEHYWAADIALTAIKATGLHARYEQVSVCGGVFVIQA